MTKQLGSKDMLANGLATQDDRLNKTVVKARSGRHQCVSEWV